MNNEIIKYIPDVEHQELMHIQDVEDELTPAEFQSFMQIYRSRRVSTQNILIFTALGLVVVAGIQRFMTNQIGMGILYLLTGGLCLVGTIYDLVNHKQIALDYNLDVLEETLTLVDRSNRRR